MTGLSATTVAARPAARAVAVPSGALALPPTVRSTSMLLINENLARARMREREAEAENQRLVRQFRVARKRRRQAEQVARRARLATAV
jgi:hypothetical protein